MAVNFQMGFDPGSLEELVRIAGFSALMDKETVLMLAGVGTMLVTAAQAKTWEVFDRPTGVLADSISFSVISPTEVAVTVGVPYGRRRELGGGGFLDSLGRPMNDRARPYLEPAVTENEDLIRAIMRDHVLIALGGIV